MKSLDRLMVHFYGLVLQAIHAFGKILFQKKLGSSGSLLGNLVYIGTNGTEIAVKPS
jgi:hypothetical protein